MSASLHLFEGYGVELEYMIVDGCTLSVLPITDKVIHSVAGEYTAEIELGALAWSNELVLHVIELKTNGPAPSLAGLAGLFQQDVARIRDILASMNARLMPGAAHPWMDPLRETVLWPHEYNPVYESFDRIFGCQGHGWSNLQCTHVNLPFAGDDEFGRLHAAIRLVLPIIPALAASSPILDGRITGLRDSRLDVYRNNANRIPSVTGLVIPEAVFSKREYEDRILEPLYRDIAPYDSEGILQFEWLNARGAIARFDRDTIELRTIDIQECPEADVAIVFAVAAVIRNIVGERWHGYSDQRKFDAPRLNTILVATTRDAEDAVIDDSGYLHALGYPGASCTAGELWRSLVDTTVSQSPNDGVRWEASISTILREGTLAARILRSLNGDTSPRRLQSVYSRLCDCLDRGLMFHAK